MSANTEKTPAPKPLDPAEAVTPVRRPTPAYGSEPADAPPEPHEVDATVPIVESPSSPAAPPPNGEPPAESSTDPTAPIAGQGQSDGDGDGDGDGGSSVTLEVPMIDEAALEDQPAGPAGDTLGIPATPLVPDRERTRTPISVDLVAQALATPPKAAGAHEPDEVIDEDVEIVDAPPIAAPVAIPPIPAEASGRVAPSPPPLPMVAMIPPDAAPPARPRIPTPMPPATPEALAQRTRRKRSKPWFEEVFDEDYLRTLPFMTADQTVREASFIEESLQPPKGGEILDVACGYGRHAIELAQRGLKLTGLDLSLPLLIRAADESQRRQLQVNFVHADMREMAFDAQFDGAYSMLTSFGYFDEETNMRVAEGISRALKPGGRFLIDAVNRDYIVGDLPTRVWWEGDGCVVLEEVDFNFHTSRILTRRSIVFEDGRQIEQEISIRAYSLHELGKLLRNAGFRVLDVSGEMATRGRFFGSNSHNLVILCEKRGD